jgi:hypothetical protein
MDIETFAEAINQTKTDEIDALQRQQSKDLGYL